MALIKLNKYDEAIKAIEVTLTVKPDFFDALYNMACTDAFMGNKEKVSNSLSKPSKEKNDGLSSKVFK